jgi:hypothetical protein
MDPDETDREESARKGRLLPGERISELRGLTETGLIESYNALVEETGRPINRDAQMRYMARAQVYADELARRENARQPARGSGWRR